MHGPSEGREEEDDLEERVAELMGGSGAPFRAIEGDAIPQPYRDLLVHDGGMTATLEAYWKRPLYLRPLSIRREGDVLVRHVVLVAAEIDRPVGFGAIRLHLNRFEERLGPEILASRTPLGAILREHGVAHRSRLTGFFEVESDALAQTGFDPHEHQTLYGRHNVLLSPSGEVMAEVVEILPPCELPSP